MEWILEKLPVLIFIVVFLAQIVRGVLRSRENRSEPPPRHDELEAQRRAQEIQAEIRRKIAERRAGGRTEAPAAPPRAEPAEPPVVVRRDPTAIPDPLEGPLRRMFEEIEKRVQPAAPAPMPEPPPLISSRSAELERQERLADEMRALQEARATAQRRAAQTAAAKAEEERSTRGLRTAARGRLLEDLQDPESLRRAFVLREVLGPPVGLR